MAVPNFGHQTSSKLSQTLLLASIEDPVVITKILSHRNKKNDEIVKIFIPENRAPPQASLFE